VVDKPHRIMDLDLQAQKLPPDTSLSALCGMGNWQGISSPQCQITSLGVWNTPSAIPMTLLALGP